MGQAFDAGGFDDATFGGEISAEDVQSAGFFEGFETGRITF